MHFGFSPTLAFVSQRSQAIYSAVNEYLARSSDKMEWRRNLIPQSYCSWQEIIVKMLLGAITEHVLKFYFIWWIVYRKTQALQRVLHKTVEAIRKRPSVLLDFTGQIRLQDTFSSVLLAFSTCPCSKFIAHNRVKGSRPSWYFENASNLMLIAEHEMQNQFHMTSNHWLSYEVDGVCHCWENYRLSFTRMRKE